MSEVAVKFTRDEATRAPDPAGGRKPPPAPRRRNEGKYQSCQLSQALLVFFEAVAGGHRQRPEIDRYHELAGDTSFVRGRLPKPGAVSAEKPYGSSQSYGPPGRYPGTGPSGRPQSR